MEDPRPCVSFHKDLIITTNTHESAERSAHGISQQLRPEYEEEKMMKSLFEKLGGTYTLGADGMLYPNLTLETTEHRPIGKWGRMHQAYLEAKHPGLYEQLILNGTLYRYLADANERAEDMIARLTEQMAKQEHITEHLKAEQPMAWVGKMNSIRNRAEEIVREEVINTL